MRPWNPNTKSTGRSGDWTPPLRQTVPVGAHCASAHWATEAGCQSTQAHNISYAAYSQLQTLCSLHCHYVTDLQLEKWQKFSHQCCTRYSFQSYLIMQNRRNWSHMISRTIKRKLQHKLKRKKETDYSKQNWASDAPSVKKTCPSL